MITPRQTRLVRVADLHDFRKVVIRLAAEHVNGRARSAAIVVPNRGAVRELGRTLDAGSPGIILTTRDQLYDLLHERLGNAPRRLTTFERDAIAQAAADEAARQIEALPFRIRPGLVAEMLRFYDLLRRQSQQVGRFETLIGDALGGSDGLDRGADRRLQQTRFLATAFRAYEQRVRQSGAWDEHLLRDRLMVEAGSAPLRHVIVTVSDWIAEPTGLFVADFDLLSRIPGLETIDIVCTESVLGSGFHERVHSWWPGLDEVNAGAVIDVLEPIRPRLVIPVSPEGDRPWFTCRDREDELVAVAHRLNSDLDRPPIWDRVAVVFKRPLPYLYLAPDTLGAAGIPYQGTDALPLAAEPLVATLDLIVDAVATRFTRESLVALLGSPFLLGATPQSASAAASLNELNRLLSDHRYLGELERLEAVAETLEAATPVHGRPASGPRDGDLPFELDMEAEESTVRSVMARAIELARKLSELIEPAPASQQVGRLLAFLETHWTASGQTDREAQVRSAMTRVLRDLAAAHAAHHDADWTIDDLSAAIHRWIGEETSPIAASESESGIHLIDDQAARYGDFDDLTVVGLVENEWPDRPRRNIFYPPSLLKALGWPSERDRRAAADARFLDLLASSSKTVAVSTFTLEDEALVTRSLQLDEVHRARLSTIARPAIEFSLVVDESRDWTVMRRDRSPADTPVFHGAVGSRPPRPWSVSALEVYLGCPFKFFAQHVLKLKEEPDDEEVMDPRRQGQLVHEVFEAFFKEWQAAGHRAIVAADLGIARTLFTQVVDRHLERLPQSEAALERTRLLGSSAAAGLGEAVFRMEAERPVPVVERFLEHSLSGAFTFNTADGPREIHLRGKADRVDLLADGTFRVIDYKLGWPPDKGRALQLPIYGLCAEQRLKGYRGREWSLGEAVYLAFKGPKRVTPLFTSTVMRDEVLAKAQQRLVGVVDAIERGEFPPTPDDVFRCDTCSFASVCRKDYVGDV